MYRQKGAGMLHNFDDQVTQKFLMGGCESGRPARQTTGKFNAPQAYVSPIVCETYVGNIWQDDEISSNYARFSKFGHSVELTAAENLMAQTHIILGANWTRNINY